MKLDELKKQQKASAIKLSEPQEDPYILQRLALITYKSKHPNEKDALLEAHQLLNQLNPATSNDTETLGLWGAVHKRLFDLTSEVKYLDEAIRAYERGFYIRNDYYNGINYAFLLNARAAQQKDHSEAIADFIQARRVRKEVMEICEHWMKSNPMPKGNEVPEPVLNEYLNSCYWVKATMAEASMGMGETEKAEKELKEAYKKAPQDWMQASTEEQMAKLKKLTTDSPLKYVKEK